MVSNLLVKMTLGKWIALAVALAVIAFVFLTQFTTFQIPKTFTQSKPESEEPVGVQSQGSTTTRNNLDEVRDITQGRKANGQNEEAENAN